MNRRPLRAASVAFVSGVALGGWLPHEPFAWGCAAAATLACSTALLAARRCATAFRAALLLFGCAGIFRVQAELIPVFAGHDWLADADAVAAGRLGRPAERRPGELLLHLEDVRLRRDGMTVRLPGPIQVVVAAGGLDVSVGDLVTARGRLRPIRGDRNFGWFPSPVPPRARRYQARLVVASAAWISSGPGSPGRGPSAAVLRWRAAADGYWNARPGAAAGILDALTTGERGGIPVQAQESFLRSGLTHLLAISGMNVAFLVALVFLVLRRALALFEALALRCPVQLLAAALTLPALWFFVLFSGSQIPVARAGVSGAAALAAVLLWRQSGPVELCALAAFALVAADPFVLFSASFQLSFAAVGALMLVPKASALAADEGPDRASWTARWYGRARALFVVSLAASAVTAPLVAFHFQQVSLVGPLANLFAVPLAGMVVLPAGWAALGAHAIGAPIADALTVMALWSADRLVDLANWFATPSWAVVRTARPSPLLTAGLVALSAALSRGAFAWTWVRFVGCAGCAAAASAWVLATHWPTMLVTFLDVGQGLSVAAILPGGSSLLFDAGPRWREYDAGDRVVVPALRRLGVSRLDTLAISHAHPDHEGGAAAVMRHLGSGRLWRGSGAGALRRGEEPQVSSKVRVRVLNPRVGIGGSDRVDDENDRSLAMILSLGSTGVVLTGDAGSGVAGALAAAVERAPPRLALQAPHHGGSPAACGVLAAALKPEVSVVSVGRNTYGHPRPGAIVALESAGRVLRTDRDGAVVIRCDGRRMVVRTWRELSRGRTWPERVRWLVAGW